MSQTIYVNDLMQQDYVYYLTCPMGAQFDPQFIPDLTPSEMLELGVFGGRYLRDCQNEFPAEWFAKAKLYKGNKRSGDSHLNFFGIHASQSLSIWKAKGWIHPQDPRGWFQWYCRYYMGRRTEDDERQIKRWKAMKRHASQVVNNCHFGDLSCRKRQRQALLHWAYDSINM
ncbi:hypothetical protein [Sphingobacterium pedocola]|uniref:Uncharacterized protein n=1 Tax=Sphingobacterium pedocola TaxID=2082722 RepID=A0ABR9T4X5_9SPHI|nr:hypothetical protein [Sphingobacterium pedocola]MBE8720392.1 hypothetical protein [Sphingobacterium pedocola]